MMALGLVLGFVYFPVARVNSLGTSSEKVVSSEVFSVSNYGLKARKCLEQCSAELETNESYNAKNERQYSFSFYFVAVLYVSILGALIFCILKLAKICLKFMAEAKTAVSELKTMINF